MPSKEGEIMLEDFKELYIKLKEAQKAVDKGIENGLKIAGVRVMGTAKAKLGTYQPSSGPYPAWPKLKDEPVRRKFISKTKAFNINGNGQVRINVTRAGKAYLKKHGANAKIFRDDKKFVASGTSDDAPLVDTGHLKQAISIDAKDVDKGVIYVGVASGQKDAKGNSPGDYASAHEFGYAPKNIPARPFIRPSAYENRSEIKGDISEAIKEELERIWQNN